MEDALAVLRRNAQALGALMRRLGAIEAGQLSELARLVRADASAAAAAYASVYGGSLCTARYAAFCREAAAGITDPRILAAWLPEGSLTDAQPTEEPQAAGRVAYRRSAYTDLACSRFSAHLGPLAAQDQPSFAAACEEVYYGRCAYGMLPLRHSGEGLLGSFFRLIARYDLKIVCACDVAAPDGDGSVRYALLRRSLVPAVPEAGFLQVRPILTADTPCGAFLAAAEETGAKIDVLTSLPLPYTEDFSSLCISFSTDKESAAPLLLFLSGALSTYTVDGIFPLLDRE